MTEMVWRGRSNGMRSLGRPRIHWNDQVRSSLEEARSKRLAPLEIVEDRGA